MFDLFSVSDAHQRALQLERQFTRKPTTTNWSRASSSSAPQNQTTAAKPVAQPVNKTTGAVGTGFRCFKCGEPGHRFADCRKGDRAGKALFLETEDLVEEDQHEDSEHTPKYDGSEEEVSGDHGPLLVVRRVCLAP